MNKFPKGCMSTVSGKVIDPTKLKVEDIVFTDLVKSISNICRFNGNIDGFYSVAQHSVLVSEYASKNVHDDIKTDVKLACLCHDLSEVFVGDIVAPVKPSISIFAFGCNMNISQYEKHAIKIILQALDLSHLYELIEEPAGVVHIADRTLCNSESFYLRGYEILDGYPIIEEEIVPLSPKDSYNYFMEYWHETCNLDALLSR